MLATATTYSLPARGQQGEAFEENGVWAQLVRQFEFGIK